MGTFTASNRGTRNGGHISYGYTTYLKVGMYEKPYVSLESDG